MNEKHAIELKIAKTRDYIVQTSNLSIEEKAALRPCAVQYSGREADKMIPKLGGDGFTYFYYCEKCNPAGNEDHPDNQFDCDTCGTPVTIDQWYNCGLCGVNICELCLISYNESELCVDCYEKKRNN